MSEQNLHQQLTSTNPPPSGAVAELRRLILKALTHSLSGRAGGDAAFIEDMTQIATVKVLQKLPTFEGRSQFSSWVFVIAIRSAYSELRRKHWKDVSLDELKENGDSPPDEKQTANNPARENSSAELIEVLHEFINTKLTRRQRDVIQAELNGMPLDEIARQLGSKRNAIYKVGHDARKTLKRELEHAGYTLHDFRGIFTNQREKGTLWT
jgi:RNA polymerase sigma-70 factor (ECF subfamily)